MATREKIRAAEKHFHSIDAVLSTLISKHGPCTLLNSKRTRFHTLVWAIINQQLSVKAAATIEKRLLERLKIDKLEASHFYRIQERTLRACGLSGAKTRYILNLAKEVLSGRLDLVELDNLNDDEVEQILIALPGIGRWTVDMVLMFALGRLDVFPVGDLALRKSIRLQYGLGEDASPDDYIELAEPLRPYRSIASWYYWAAID